MKLKVWLRSRDVAVARGNAAIAHHDGHLVQRLGQRGPEVPVIARAAQVRARIALHGVVQVRELERIAQEEHRGVVADEIPVALLGVELHGEAADVALGISCTAPPATVVKRAKRSVFLPIFVHLRPRVFRDVVRDREGTVGPSLMYGITSRSKGEFLEEPDILQQLRAAGPRRQDILVVRDRATGVGRQFLPAHPRSPLVCPSGDCRQ